MKLSFGVFKGCIRVSGFTGTAPTTWRVTTAATSRWQKQRRPSTSTSWKWRSTRARSELKKIASGDYLVATHVDGGGVDVLTRKVSCTSKTFESIDSLFSTWKTSSTKTSCGATNGSEIPITTQYKTVGKHRRFAPWWTF